MSDAPQQYPYVTHLNVLYGPLETVDVPALAAACRERWYNQTLCRVNDSVVRLGFGVSDEGFAEALRRLGEFLRGRGHTAATLSGAEAVAR